MSSVLEKIFTTLDFIGNFLQWIYDSISSCFNYVCDGFTFLTSSVALLPPVVAGAAAVVLCIGLIYLILGR